MPPLARSWQLAQESSAHGAVATVPFWADGVADGGAGVVQTAAEAVAALAAEGYRVTYARVPMTRARPAGREAAADFDALRAQLQPNGGGRMVYAFVSQTGLGSAGFAMAIATCALGGGDGSLHRLGGNSAPPSPARPSQSDASPAESPPVSSSLELARMAERTGEPRDVIALIRLLKHGPVAKEAVDRALDMCGSAGDLRRDIAACRVRAADPQLDSSQRTAAATLGVNYLRRYLLLVAFAAFCLRRAGTIPEDAALATPPPAGGGGGSYNSSMGGSFVERSNFAERGRGAAPEHSFAAFIAERPEVQVLLSKARL